MADSGEAEADAEAEEESEAEAKAEAEAEAEVEAEAEAEAKAHCGVGNLGGDVIKPFLFQLAPCEDIKKCACGRQGGCRRRPHASVPYVGQ